MIDNSDGDFVFLASGGSLVGLVIAAILWFIAHQNSVDCSHMTCEHGSPHLMDHACLCVEDAKP